MLQYLGFIGSFPIRSYSILFVLAIILGYGVTLTLAKLQKKHELANHLSNLLIPMMIGAIVGSRFWQVFLFDWGYYSQHPGEIIAIWHGGLSIQGGIVGAVLVGIWYVRKHKLSFWELADLCAPGLILGQSIGRDANLMNGDAFGDPTGGNWGILYPEGTIARDTYGDKPLYPAEVWEGQMDIIIFALVMILLQRKMKRGYLFLITNSVYNAGRFMLEMLRGDTPKYLFHWTTAQWTAVCVILLCIVAGIYLHYKDKKRSEATA
ncbi:prolipoprotein diacylglyceryl transferase [Paenibacillus alginolyticus]|uniref:Phosphatidylglycerol--prolipoprotein diacylglyceryl transferase n=1 Tax=Paenibacillus alginolyticus TaxID=59839 RepID=A0ABT4G5T1_9BACL|nr:prolipoprotein diacylglyceryl transferase [Paenibacillus alginolyticus]MCY9691520.1 prolipoprotein diacylglyceryl transferase [Paenibacillus alginolyticus]MEC0148315.1 prolipoprotein diacylglyceryl transferase [Paenibacillus alginolyticus]